MRYALFSDIHSNLEAFEAVLDFFKKSNIDRYLFLGDVVGYGAFQGHLARVPEVENFISRAAYGLRAFHYLEFGCRYYPLRKVAGTSSGFR